jgi:trimeric autotransporter adhesin
MPNGGRELRSALAGRWKVSRSDVDGDPLTFQLLQLPEHGLISGFEPQTGTLTYTPAHAFSGTDRFTFLVSDGLTNSAPATVQLAVALPRDMDGNGIPDTNIRPERATPASPSH